ncbi:hypothetical protein GCM10010185_30770 [Saccharothrix coeruleofusca]|uniref:DUF3558 domain-containing protein n=1 Tax=Saccharothrix coeruleofusca TaxID=33919 RepID=A0A918AMA8_9PSEU|nr:hypothetical protein GCM10010185_30770 [Saccharothrix coeruleofusca]
MARTVVPLVLLGVALVGCTSNEPGSPSAATAITTDAEDATTSTRPVSGGASLADFDPCAPFNEIASQFGLTEIAEDDSTSCNAELSKSVSVRLDVHPTLGLADYRLLPHAEASDADVGARKARLVKKTFSSSSCAMAMEVTSSSRIDVVASANASLDEACDAVTKLATAVEPNLPK